MSNVLTPLTPAQRIALDWHLTTYDPSRTFEYICDQIENEDTSILVWELMEGYPANQLVELIECLAAEVQDALNKEKTS